MSAVIVTDMQMPDCCDNCYLAAGYGCVVTGEIMTTTDMKTKRSDICPLKSVDGLIDALKNGTALRCKDNVGQLFINQKDVESIIEVYCEVE